MRFRLILRRAYAHSVRAYQLVAEIGCFLRAGLVKISRTARAEQKPFYALREMLVRILSGDPARRNIYNGTFADKIVEYRSAYRVAAVDEVQRCVGVSAAVERRAYFCHVAFVASCNSAENAHLRLRVAGVQLRCKEIF